MKIVLGTARVLMVALLLYCATTILEDRYRGSFPAAGSYPFGAGNAPQSIRSEVLETIGHFQEGYLDRDPAALVQFMSKLFSPTNIVILGTMPQEIYVGLENATELVGSDWEEWGTCVFDIANTHVSTLGDVAWFSTGGYVEFDLSSLLVLPLRISGVLVREQGSWQFQLLQFQFDLDISLVLLISVLLAFWLVVEVIALAITAIRQIRRGMGAKTDGCHVHIC